MEFQVIKRRVLVKARSRDLDRSEGAWIVNSARRKHSVSGAAGKPNLLESFSKLPDLFPPGLCVEPGAQVHGSQEIWWYAKLSVLGFLVVDVVSNDDG